MSEKNQNFEMEQDNRETEFSQQEPEKGGAFIQSGDEEIVIDLKSLKGKISGYKEKNIAE